jgi:hypothetical protein
MNRNSRLMDVAVRLWTSGHGRFEEMCALAATGHLGGPQMCELDQHLVTCDSCRERLRSFSHASINAVPLLTASRTSAEDVPPVEGIRARFLNRLAAEDFKAKREKTATPQPVIISSAVSPSAETSRELNGKYGTAPKGRSAWFHFAWRLTAALGACAAIALMGIYIGEQRIRRQTSPIIETHSSNTPVMLPNVSVDDSARVEQLEQQKLLLANQLAQAKEELSRATSEQNSLRDELAASERLAESRTQVQSISKPAGNEVERNQVTSLQTEVDQLRLRLAESEFTLAAQKHGADELSTKLELTEAELHREQELKSATSQFEDVLGARNLHIVDVYDAEDNGKRRNAVGRVFYIEGKSLVFYAYDLDAPGQFKSNVVFHVWGGHVGQKDVTHSLGILHKDDVGQNRWAMTFDDPNVLKQINSVFVTAEASNKPENQPRGKKILFAYFGGRPNHQ